MEVHEAKNAMYKIVTVCSSNAVFNIWWSLGNMQLLSIFLA